MSTEQNDAKMRTIEELKAAEARKSQAADSLQRKLLQLQATLPEEEKQALTHLLGVHRQASSADSPDEVSVFFKPMQVHAGEGAENFSVFFKPMQVHTGGGGKEVSVFFKPMQIATAPGSEQISVFFKPMQVHAPQQGGLASQPGEAAENDAH